MRGSYLHLISNTALHITFFHSTILVDYVPSNANDKIEKVNDNDNNGSITWDDVVAMEDAARELEEVPVPASPPVIDPGSDGLPMKFYVKSWPILGTDLVNVLNSCYFSGVMSLTQGRGLISFVFKESARLDPRNRSPITLLNVDYKLSDRVVAGCLLKVIHLIVAEDQTCGVPGRFIVENVSIICDVVSFASRTGVPLAVLSLDQEKAFDRVDWGFMGATLGGMGFKYPFLRWVSLFYTQVQSAVIVNGHISPFFSLSRGVRQGCPLSPLLYVLVAETLAVNIRCNPRIPGLCLETFRPLTYILNLTLKHGIFPDSLKIAKVIPVFKQGPRSSGGNYRPISVLSALSKIFERCILNQLKYYCLTENIVASNQYGFRSGYNTTVCLVDLIDEVTKALDEDEYAVSIFLDLIKAFDTVNHSILSSKLELYGIRGNENQWFRSYLSNRKQKVFVNGVESNFLF